MTAAQLVLRNGTALAGPGLQETPFASLTVSDGLITGISPAASAGQGQDRGQDRGQTHNLGQGQDPDELDLSGKYVLPGLIDAHVHLDLIAEISPYAHWRRPPLERALGLAGNGLTALRHGITTVRDLGCFDHAVIQYARLADSGRVLGPRVIAAGRWVCMTGGHGWEYGREADGEAEVRKAVREQVRAGAGVIKLMATGGMSTPGSPYAAELTVQEMAAGAEEAHKAGLSVAAHAHSPAGIRAALAAGVDSIEHGAFMTAAELEEMNRLGTFLVPTAVAVEEVRPGSGIDPEVVAKTEAAREKFHASTAAALRSGVAVAAGTDAGTALNPVGPTLLNELRLYARFGADTRTVLAAATVTAGRLVGQDLGVIDPGRPADLIILDRNPLDDLGALGDVAGVISRGRLLDLANLEAAAAAITGTGTVTGKEASRP